MAVLIYGASDDLIEVEGDVEDEFNVYDPAYLALSNGVVLFIEYTKSGIWRIRVDAGHEHVQIEPATSDDGRDDLGYPNYSDKAVVTGLITSVTCSKRLPA